MFDRAMYKAQALDQLKNRWLAPCLVVVSIIAVSIGFGRIYKFLSVANFGGRFNWLVFALNVCFSGISVMVLSYVHLKLSRTTEPVKSDDVFVAIGEYALEGILGVLWYWLWLFLWSLLFFIPAIVKFYAYSQMFFVMVENPGIGPMKAMNISKVMTNGHKADLFVMSLSFLGWAFLSSLAFGIGYIWLVPYSTTAFANAYTALKIEAINSGRLTPADFSK